MDSYDALVIGSGPGGYIAAIRAAQLGLRTAVVEREHLAGICSNWGCIPTKALLRSAEAMSIAAHGKDYGVEIDGTVKPNIRAMVARSRGIAERMNGGVGMLMKKNKIDVIWGEARLAGIGEVAVSKSSKAPMQPQAPRPKTVKGEGLYRARHIIIATGARPVVLPGLEPDGRLVWTYFDAMVPEAIPGSLLVVGSGAIGLEFASFYRALGVDVTVVELMARILPGEDAEVSEFVRKRLEKEGMKFILQSRVSGIEKTDASVTAHIAMNDGSARAIVADRLLTAVGVQPNVEGLGLETLGIRLRDGAIEVDGHCRTSAPNVYAIGDVAGPPMLAHKAEHEAVICVEKIAGLDVAPLDKTLVPGCTYCSPQVASVGLTEEKSRQAGHDIRIGRFPFAANGKAVALGESQGFVKTIFEKETGQLLGAHMAGPDVTELIHGFVVMMNLETTEEELFHTVFPHPTLSEAMKESALDAFGHALNT